MLIPSGINYVGNKFRMLSTVLDNLDTSRHSFIDAFCGGGVVGVNASDYYNNVDNDGHIFVQCINIKDQDVLIKKGEPVAQGIFQKYLVVDDDNATGTRVGGFGSTDLNK